MRDPPWKRLGLDADEWRECRRAALEMSAATGARVSPHAVAVEYAMARDLDEPALIPPVHLDALPNPQRRTLALR